MSDPRVEASKMAILDRLGTRVDFLMKRQFATRLAQASIAAADRADREQDILRISKDELEHIVNVARASAFPNPYGSKR